MVFEDKKNFEGCLNSINITRQKGRKRFWKIQEYHNFFFKKLGSLDVWKERELKLVRAYIYTGEYPEDIMPKLKRFCGTKIKKLKELIKNEDTLLYDISNEKNITPQLRKNIELRVNLLKKFLEDEKNRTIEVVNKQSRNIIGQKNLFEKINKWNFLQLKTTELKHAKGRIFQKGVDIQMASDILHFAHTNSYDIALLLGGDSDFIESIKLARKVLGKVIILVSYFDPENMKLNCLNKDVTSEVDYFINLKDLTEEEILSISDLRR